MRAENFTSYEEALAWLHSLLRFGQRPGLERMLWMLQELDHPERTLAFVHVAGTNGKGSVCAYLAHVLREAGYTTGEFTSPYLLDFRERIRYNGDWISETDLLSLVNELKPLVERCEAESPYGSPTEFEAITLLAILYYARIVRPAIVIWETGLGGRLDSTNVVQPLITVITSIGMDHTDVLGMTLAEIAREKAGIIKPGVPLVLGDVPAEAEAAIREIAASKRATVYRSGDQFSAFALTERLGEQTIRYQSLFRREASTYQLKLNGVHQTANAAVALMTLDVLREYRSFLIEESQIADGLSRTSWPGRMELTSRSPVILLDGAHNEEGMRALVTSMERLLPQGSRVHLLLAALSDKPLERMAGTWRALGDRLATVYATSFDFPRAASTEELVRRWREGGGKDGRISPIPDWRTFLRTWQAEADRHTDDWLVVCGSLYFISQVRATLSISVEEAGE